MYIYNKFCVHLCNVANGFLSSPPPNDIFVIVAAVRLCSSIMVSQPPTEEPSPATTDLIAQRPSGRRPSDSNEPVGVRNLNRERENRKEAVI